MRSCSLTALPNLSGLYQLKSVNLNNNRLFQVNGIAGPYFLGLENNLFTDIPKLQSLTSLTYLYMTNNPLKNMATIISHTNLRSLALENTTLSFIPPTIDKLKTLQELYLPNNKLFYLPTNILNLPKLRRLDIRNNLFAPNDILALQIHFNQSSPTTTVFY